MYTLHDMQEMSKHLQFFVIQDPKYDKFYEFWILTSAIHTQNIISVPKFVIETREKEHFIRKKIVIVHGGSFLHNGRRPSQMSFTEYPFLMINTLTMFFHRILLAQKNSDLPNCAPFTLKGLKFCSCIPYNTYRFQYLCTLINLTIILKTPRKYYMKMTS